MTYGSNNWHRQIGRANRNAEMEIAAAETRRDMDQKAIEKFAEGESVEVEKDGQTIRGFISEINKENLKISVENWNHAVTVEARKVEYY